MDNSGKIILRLGFALATIASGLGGSQAAAPHDGGGALGRDCLGRRIRQPDRQRGLGAWAAAGCP